MNQPQPPSATKSKSVIEIEFVQGIRFGTDVMSSIGRDRQPKTLVEMVPNGVWVTHKGANCFVPNSQIRCARVE